MANPESPPDFPPQMRPQAFADFLGVSLKTVQRNIDRGMPVLAGGGKGFAKSIPVAAALAWLSGPPQKPGGAVDLLISAPEAPSQTRAAA